jgi:rod shape-determining protein MreD
MINQIIRNLFRFILLVLVQVLIVKNIDMGRFINPFLYVLFIIMLPFDTPKWMLLVSSFLLGITVDMFYDSMGMHAAACVFMAYCRPGVLSLIAPREGYESTIQPTIQHLGAPWFFSYTGMLVLLHHFALFYIEVFRFSEFFTTFLRVILSSLFTLLLITVVQFLFYKKERS